MNNGDTAAPGFDQEIDSVEASRSEVLTQNFLSMAVVNYDGVGLSFFSVLTLERGHQDIGKV